MAFYGMMTKKNEEAVQALRDALKAAENELKGDYFNGTVKPLVVPFGTWFNDWRGWPNSAGFLSMKTVERGFSVRSNIIKGFTSEMEEQPKL